MATPKKKAQAKTARKKVTHKVDYKNTVEVQGVDPIDEVKLAAKVTGIETPKVNSAALTKLRQAKAKRDEASKQQEPAKTASINTDQPKQKKGGKTISGEVEKIEGKVWRPKVERQSMAMKLKPRLQMGCSIRDACVEAKVSRGTVQERLKDTPEFYDQIEGFMSHIERLAQKVVYTKIKQGDDYNARRLLERRRRKTYATRTDHTTNDEAINLQFGVWPSQFIDPTKQKNQLEETDRPDLNIDDPAGER